MCFACRCPTLRASVVVTAAHIVEAAPPCVTAHSACFGPVAPTRSSSAVSPAALLPWDHLLPGGARSSPVFSPQCCREPLPGGTLLRLAFKPLGRRRLSILPWSDFQHFDCFVSQSNLPRFDIAWGPLSFLQLHLSLPQDSGCLGDSLLSAASSCLILGRPWRKPSSAGARESCACSQRRRWGWMAWSLGDGSTSGTSWTAISFVRQSLFIIFSFFSRLSAHY